MCDEPEDEGEGRPVERRGAGIVLSFHNYISGEKWEETMLDLLLDDCLELPPLEDDEPTKVYVEQLGSMRCGIILVVLIQDRERPNLWDICILEGFYA